MSRSVYIYSELSVDEFEKTVCENRLAFEVLQSFQCISFTSIEIKEYYQEIAREFNLPFGSVLSFKWVSGDYDFQKFLSILENIDNIGEIVMILDGEYIVLSLSD